MKRIRIIGDVHGHNSHYRKLLDDDLAGSVQLGDMGFSDDYEELKEHVDPNTHRFVPGNHDNYDDLPPHAYSEDYGMEEVGGLRFFYIRGADSVDKHRRIPGVSWWDREQITWSVGYDILKAVDEHKPDIILSHDCPADCVYIGRPEEPLDVQRSRGVITNKSKLNLSITNQVLTAVFEQHQPKLWVFGHHHHNWTERIAETRFICLDSLCHLDICVFEDGLRSLLSTHHNLEFTF
jgi:predicted phosphodiesterase